MASLVALNHLGHCVTDLARARRFYEEVLGFEFDRELNIPDEPANRLLRIDPPLGMTAVYLRRDSFILELMTFDRAGNPPVRQRVVNEPGLTHLSFSVEDVVATAERVREFGGEVLSDTDLGVAVFVRDPDGQLIELLAISWLQGLERR